ncbi:hypothetical protein D3C84_899230 [compost metagenome]
MQPQPHVADKGQRAQIAALQAVLAHHGAAGIIHLGLAVGHVHPVDLGGVEQAAGVLLQAEDAGPPGGVVGAHPLEHRGAVVQGVAHDVDLGILPGHQAAVEPDVLGVSGGLGRL